MKAQNIQLNPKPSKLAGSPTSATQRPNHISNISAACSKTVSYQKVGALLEKPSPSRIHSSHVDLSYDPVQGVMRCNHRSVPVRTDSSRRRPLGRMPPRAT
ncbi:hypothetical protein JYU34_017423 [Plutella xylostella]|uniref:Uncharacterized protein n=1 Tax=Plutella xylostella TaxID=51655 RepID=A0ABQ7Q168_PLUXY|nr:hypothetical protein JYU34_017423 [Plutella xylostella]